MSNAVTPKTPRKNASAKIDTPKSKKKTLEERVNEYERGLLVIRTILGKKRLFCRKCNKDLGDDQIRKSQIDQHINSDSHKSCLKRSNLNRKNC